MEPVVGVDVAKGSSVIQAFQKRNEPVGKAIVIEHVASGFEQFTEVLGALQAERVLLQWLFWRRLGITIVPWCPV